jgi:Trk-type K+ transport system membrane component
MNFSFSYDDALTGFTLIVLLGSVFSLLVFVAVKYDKIKYKSELIAIVVLIVSFILTSRQVALHTYLYLADPSDLTAIYVQSIESFHENFGKSLKIQGISFVVNGERELEYKSSAPNFYKVYYYIRYNKEKEPLTLKIYPKNWMYPRLFQIEAGTKAVVSFNESVEYQKKRIFYYIFNYMMVLAVYLIIRVVAVKKGWFEKIDQAFSHSRCA